MTPSEPKSSPNFDTEEPFLFNNDIDEDDEYLDDEPRRKPKSGKNLRKFRHPLDK